MVFRIRELRIGALCATDAGKESGEGEKETSHRHRWI